MKVMMSLSCIILEPGPKASILSSAGMHLLMSPLPPLLLLPRGAIVVV